MAEHGQGGGLDGGPRAARSADGYVQDPQTMNTNEELRMAEGMAGHEQERGWGRDEEADWQDEEEAGTEQGRGAHAQGHEGHAEHARGGGGPEPDAEDGHGGRGRGPAPSTSWHPGQEQDNYERPRFGDPGAQPGRGHPREEGAGAGGWQQEGRQGKGGHAQQWQAQHPPHPEQPPGHRPPSGGQMQPPHYPMGAPSEAWHHIRGGGGEPRPQSAPPQTWPARPPVRHREAPGASRPHKGGLPSVPSSESLERLRGAMAQVQAAQAHPEQHDMRAPPHGFREGPEQEMAPMGVPSHLEIMQMRQAAAAMAAAKYASRQAEGLLDRGQGGRPEGRAGPGDGGAGGSARVALDGMAISPAVVEERQRQWLLMQQHQQALLQHRLQQQQQGQMSEEQFQAAMMAQQQLARMHAWRGPHPGMPHPLAALGMGLGMGMGQPPLQAQGGRQPQSIPHPMPQRHAQSEGSHPPERGGGFREDGPGQGQGSESRPPRSSLASASQRASSPQTVSYQSNLERPDFERERRYVMQQRARQQQLQEQQQQQQQHSQQHSQQQQAASSRWGAASLDTSQQGLPPTSQRRSPGPSSWGAGPAQSQEVQGGMPRVRSREQLSGEMRRSRSRDSLERHPLAQQQRAQPPPVARFPQVPRTLSPTSTAPSSFEAGSAEHGIRGGPQTSAGGAVQRPPEREYPGGEKEGPERLGSHNEEWEERRSAEAVRQARVQMSHLAGPSSQHDERAHLRPSSAPRVPAFSGPVSTGARPEGRSEGGSQRRPGSAQEGGRGKGPGGGRDWGGRDAGQVREGMREGLTRQAGRASPVLGGSARGPLAVREWLNRPERVVNRVENLHLFRQVVLLLEAAHRQGTVVRGVRPSNLILTGALKVSLADAEEGVGTPKVVSSATRSNTSGRLGSSHPSGARAAPSGSSQGSLPNRTPPETSPVAETSEALEEQGPEGPETGSGAPSARQGGGMSNARPGEEGRREGAEGHGGEQESGGREAEGAGGRGGRAEKGKQTAAAPVKRAMSPGEAAESAWYTSPEEMMGHVASPMSDMYSLGVLFFELFLPPSAPAERARVMADLRHRILPPWLLLEHSKEAAFMLWLLHPEPNARPRARDVLQSDLLAEATDALAERQAAIDLEEAEAETEVLSEFLQAMAAQKAAAAAQLRTDLQRLTHDIQEVGRRRAAMAPPGEEPEKRWGPGGEAKGAKRKRTEEEAGEEDEEDEEEDDGGEVLRSPAVARKAEARRSKRSRVMRNFEHLEKVYFATRWSSAAREGGALLAPLGGDGRRPGSTHSGSELRSGGEPSGSNREPGSSLTGVLNPPRKERHRSRAPGGGDWLGTFFDSLCKFARYSRFEVRATLRHGDLLNTANMVCSLGFDRDDEFFATAGVCKRIKVFECNAVLSEGVDIHYPVVEMVSRSKLSSICWNNYIKSHIASSDYEGIVQLWDASTSQVVMHYEEHEKRAWSVDFSKADPTRLASGGDDGCVKLWSISQEPSVSTIKTKANVCCVQFSAESSHLIAFGSADYKVYAYDLRSTRAPLAVLAGHGKAVSYVKFVDGGTLVSASTDNTLKLWDLAKGTNPTTAPAACTLSYTGHTNEKNFVGLSVSDGYIACGSENNAVYAYHKSLPMPMASHAFRGADPVTGQEIEDDAGQFVSSVCWREKSNMLVAANSMGNIKLLEMV